MMQYQLIEYKDSIIYKLLIINNYILYVNNVTFS